MYRINNIKNYLKCPRYYYLSNQDLNNKDIVYLRNDFSVTDLMLRKYCVGKYLLGKKNDGNEVFFANINNYNWFAKIRINDNNFRVKIPLLHKIDDLNFELYYFQASSYVKIDDYIYFRSHIQVLEKFGIYISKITILTVNDEYVKDDDYDFDKLLISHSMIIDFKKNNKINIIDYIKSKTNDIKSLINQIQKYNDDNYRIFKSKKCFYKGKCKYFDVCFKEEVYPENSILTLVQSQYKNEMYNCGIKTLKDAKINKIEGTKQQYAQIMADKLNGFYKDNLGLKMWIDNIKKFPISFLDFEWDTFLIPPYKNMKTFSSLCFEYSLHTLDEYGNLKHHCYIGSGDCRQEFIEDLLKNIPKKGSIFAYNAYGAEIIRLKEIATQFPCYQDKINDLIDRFIDLSEPFTKGIVYDVKMKGNYSIKTLLSIVSDLSYDFLDIKDGMEAVEMWRILDRKATDNQKQIINSLKKYCSFDTYAMYKVYLWLLEMI